MSDIEYIKHNLTDEDILCSIAEEASELAKAALKLRRAMTGTNPTPVTEVEAMNNLYEEYGDVLGAFRVFFLHVGNEDELNEIINDNINAKYHRWANRIKESKSRD